MPRNQIDGDFHVSGTFTANNMSVPANSVGDSQVDSSRPLGTSKTKHQHAVGYAQPRGTAVVAERRVVHSVVGDGTLVGVAACLTVANTGGTVGVDVYKNGVTVLSGTISITTEAAFTQVFATIADDTAAADDVFEVVVTVSGSVVGQGLGVRLLFDEAAG